MNSYPKIFQLEEMLPVYYNGNKISNPTLEKIYTIKNEIENEIDKSYTEGANEQRIINSKKRSREARNACIKIYGLSCFVCGFNFLDSYGDIGNEYIHVHHINPLFLRDKEYEINPEKDLIPVCPNCHAMLHRKNSDGDYYSPEKLKEIFNKQNQKIYVEGKNE